MTRAIWSAAALADFDGIDRYYRDRSPTVARRIGKLAVKARLTLAADPRLGSLIRDDMRRWRVRGTPYIILYREIADGIDIARLTHVRRNWRVSS